MSPSSPSRVRTVPDLAFAAAILAVAEWARRRLGTDADPAYAIAAIVALFHAPFVWLPIRLAGPLRAVWSEMADPDSSPRERWGLHVWRAVRTRFLFAILPPLMALPFIAAALLGSGNIGMYVLALGAIAVPSACAVGWLLLLHDALRELHSELAKPEGTAPSLRSIAALAGPAFMKSSLIYGFVIVCSLQPPFLTGASLTFFAMSLTIRRIYDRLGDIDSAMRARRWKHSPTSQPPLPPNET